MLQMFGMDVTFPANKGDKIWFYNQDESGEEAAAAEAKLIIDGNGVAAEVIEQVPITMINTQGWYGLGRV